MVLAYDYTVVFFIIWSRLINSKPFIFKSTCSNTDLLVNTTEIKKRTVVNRMNISPIAKFLDQRLRLELVHGLILSSVDFCNSLYCELSNKDLRSLRCLLTPRHEWWKEFCTGPMSAVRRYESSCSSCYLGENNVQNMPACLQNN